MKIYLSLVFAFYSFLAFNQNVFTEEEMWKLKRISNVDINTSGSQIIYQCKSNWFENGQEFSSSEYKRITLNDGKNETSSLPNSTDFVGNVLWFNDNEVVGFIKGKEDKSLIKQKIDGTQRKVLIANCSNIHEFKISPKGNYLIALKSIKVKEEVTDVHTDLVKAQAYCYDDLMYRHWDSWDNGIAQQLVLFSLSENVGNAAPINILEGSSNQGILPPFGGLETVNFTADETKLFYVSKKMNGKAFATSTNSDIFQYNLVSGETTNISALNMGYDTNPTCSPKGEKVAWLSMKNDGFEADKNDLIVFSQNELINLTHEIDLTISSYCWAKNGKSIYFIAPKEGTQQIFEIDIQTKKYRQITAGDYNYTSVIVLKDCMIATRQSMLHPNEIFQLKFNGEAINLSNENNLFLDKFNEPQIEKRWITTSDNKRMLTWVILPPDFDEQKKYPALLYCQGGPQSAVSQFFSFRWNFRVMASRGYVVIAPNRRGLPGFGQEWNDAISKDWGGQSIQDYLAAVDSIKKESFVDENRIGAIGASYGGYSVYYLAGNHDGRFKSFISHCGLFNLTSWYGSTEELFFANWDIGGPYWEEKNKTLYQKNSPHNYVQNWDTPIMVIHGGKDYRVPYTQGLEAYQAAQIKGLKSRLLFFPEENHWVSSLHNSILWHREFYKWLQETL